MGGNKKKTTKVSWKSSISQAKTLEKIGEFWDTHDFADYDDPTKLDVEFKVISAATVNSVTPREIPPS